MFFTNMTAALYFNLLFVLKLFQSCSNRIKIKRGTKCNNYFTQINLHGIENGGFENGGVKDQDVEKQKEKEKVKPVSITSSDSSEFATYVFKLVLTLIAYYVLD